jgi:hypothetical protein
VQCFASRGSWKSSPNSPGNLKMAAPDIKLGMVLCSLLILLLGLPHSIKLHIYICIIMYIYINIIIYIYQLYRDISWLLLVLHPYTTNMLADEESLHDLSPAVSWLSVSTVVALDSFKLAYSDI